VRLTGRLAAIEKRRSVKHWVSPIYEVRLLRGWPECQADLEENYQPCDEHGPTCGVSISGGPSSGLRRVILMDGTWP
jgi:hypothetical protein